MNTAGRKHNRTRTVPSARGVAGPVRFACVGLGLDQPHHAGPALEAPHEQATEQVARDLERRPGEEPDRQPAQRRGGVG